MINLLLSIFSMPAKALGVLLVLRAREEFYNDEMMQEAIIRKFEVIGEASNRISDDLKNKLSDLPWKKMKAMRNILIHMYDELELEIVWDTAINDIPILKDKIKKIISSLET